MVHNLIFLGVQGSGKGTQAKKLLADYGYKMFETGAELRKIAKSDTELGRKIAHIINGGNLVDANTIMELVSDFITNNSQDKIIFDGVPRNQEQYDAFLALEQKLQLQTTVVNFDLDDQTAIQRLLKRASIENRADDTPQAIQKRIQIFHTQTKPLLDQFANSHQVIHVNANQDIDAIYTELLSKLNLNG